MVVPFWHHHHQIGVGPVLRPAIRGGGDHVRIHPRAADHDERSSVRRHAEPGHGGVVGEVRRRQWGRYRVELGGPGQGRMGADHGPQPPGPGQRVGWMRRRPGAAHGGHRPYYLGQSPTRVGVAAQLSPGSPVVSPDPDLQPPVDHAGHLEAENFTTQNAVLHQRLGAVSDAGLL